MKSFILHVYREKVREQTKTGGNAIEDVLPIICIKMANPYFSQQIGPVPQELRLTNFAQSNLQIWFMNKQKAYFSRR